MSNPSYNGESPSAFLDARGLSCPLPLLKAKKIMNSLKSGEILEVLATDPAALSDFKAFSLQTGHPLLHHQAMMEGKTLRICIQKK